LGKNALVTGAGGFIGSHLVEGLLARGWEVNALVHYNSRSGWGWLESSRARPGLRVTALDVTDPFQVRQTVQGCDVVFHLAALIGIPYSYSAYSSYFATNLNGTLNVARAALDAGARCMVHTSTSEVYGTARYIPIDEDHPLQAQSPYAASKIAADKLVESFVASFGLTAVTVRPFNTYGPRQSTRAVIPTIITQALGQGEIFLGSLRPVRDLTFVEDTVAGMIAAAESGVPGQVYNLGVGQGISIGALAELLCDILGVPAVIRADEARVRPEASEAWQLVSDNRRAREGLCWMPRVGLREGLVATVDWFRHHLHLYPAREYSV
jgi:dTDP-glucose 4,6-dehydratase